MWIKPALSTGLHKFFLQGAKQSPYLSTLSTGFFPDFPQDMDKYISNL